MSFVRFGLAAAAVIYAAFFALKNLEPVSLDLVFFELGPMPMALASLAAVGVGALLAGLVLAWPVLHARSQRRRDLRRIEELERELHGLRTLPLNSRDAEASKASGA